MLRLMLSHHPQIAFGGEFEFVVDAIGADGRFPDLDSFIDVLRRDRVFPHFRVELRHQPDFARQVDDILDQKRQGRDVAVLGATVHRHFDRLLRIWPDARFLHIVRDGRDVALSTIPMGWAGNAYSGIERWIEAEALWAQLAASLPPERFTTIRYETLISDPPTELARICGFLGVPYDPAMLSYDGSSTYSKPNARSIGNWRKADPAVIAAAESRAAPWLEANGYALSGPVSPPSPLRRLGFKAENRVKIAWFRFRRYGPRLWLEDMVSRRIGPRGWRHAVQRQVVKVDDRFVK